MNSQRGANLQPRYTDMALQDLTPQLRTRLRRVEKLVGLFVAVATLLLLAGFAYYLYHTAERKGWFVEKCPYYTYVNSAEGLKEGDPVMLMGFSVGEITVIEAQPPGSWYKVFVGFEIKDPYFGYIWTDSKVKVASADFLGHREMEVTTGVTGRPTAYEQGVDLTEILINNKRVALKKAPKGVFLQPDEHPALTERAEKLVGQVESALPNILSLTNQIHTVLTNTSALLANLDTTVRQTQPVLSNAAVITANLRDPHGSLGEWLITTNLNAEITTLASNLNQTLLNLADITSNLNTQVQANDQILSEISGLVKETDDLVQGLKRHWLLKGAFARPKAKPPEPIREPQIEPPAPKDK